MHIAFIIPEDTPPTGGNTATANRLQRGLAEQGVSATVDHYWKRHLPKRADLYHALNAVRVGIPLLEEAVVDARRMVVSWTGTDLWQDWRRSPETYRKALEAVPCHVVFTDDARAELLSAAPHWEGRIWVVPPSVDETEFCPEGPQAEDVKNWGGPVVLLSGGVRPVKRSAWAVELVHRTRESTGVNIQLAVLGPVRHVGEWHLLEERAQGRDWVHLVGEVPYDRMPMWYRAADVVLNTSSVEGVSNALMEAMATGSAILASDIPGNRYLIQDGVNGRFFENAQDFAVVLGELVADSELRRALGYRARARILARHTLTQEITAYRRLYQTVLTLADGPESLR